MNKEKSTPEKDALEVKNAEDQPKALISEVNAEEQSTPTSEKVQQEIQAEETQISDTENKNVEVEVSKSAPELKPEKKEKETILAPSESESIIEKSEQTPQEGKVIEAEKNPSADKDVTEVKDVEEKQPALDIADTEIETYSRDQLVDLLEQIVKETDISLIKKKVATIKVLFLKLNKIEREKKKEQFISDGGNIEEYEHVSDNLEDKFKVLFDIYKHNKAKFNKSQEELKLKNLDLKKQILEDLKALNNSEETLKKTYDEFKVLQEKWKEIGIVPQAEINNLWQSYHFLIEMFFDKVKINKELRDLDLKKNLEAKVELCEKTEELLLEPSITKSFKELQNFHDHWKKIGPVPMEVKEEIWERFKQATDKINERRREFYSDLHEEQLKNLEAKTNLCEQAEELLEVELNTLKEWQEQTDKVNKLLEVWKTIGPAPKKHNDEIWRRFKAVLNSFFDVKKEFYGKLKEQQLNNYNKKLDLCLQAESLMDSDDWKKTTIDLINFQKEWKTIGPVPKKYSDKVWKRFRAACDKFFSNKAEYYANIHVHEESNFKLKKELIQKIKDYSFGDDKKKNLGVFKNFQREWMDIGHVPIKEKESLQNEFRKVVNSHLEKLKINQVEINTINYKSKIENLSESSNSRNFIYKERIFLTNKITKMKEDINLWENNMGFFAESKNANLLKIEFEKKIENAKKDLEVMQAKLKVINSSEIS